MGFFINRWLLILKGMVIPLWKFSKGVVKLGGVAKVFFQFFQGGRLFGGGRLLGTREYIYTAAVDTRHAMLLL